MLQGLCGFGASRGLACSLKAIHLSLQNPTSWDADPQNLLGFPEARENQPMGLAVAIWSRLFHNAPVGGEGKIGGLIRKDISAHLLGHDQAGTHARIGGGIPIRIVYEAFRFGGNT